jgi:anionic cell wall polymer biosynthesis LytR-Cps2A-Psr (LCP) family protein
LAGEDFLVGLDRQRGDVAGQDPRHRRQETRQPGQLRTGTVSLAVVSLLVLVLTGYGWYSIRSLTGGLSTSDVISSPGTDADGATDILLVGMDSRTDAHGNPLPASVLAALRAGDNAGELTDTLILVHIPTNGSAATASGVSLK